MRSRVPEVAVHACPSKMSATADTQIGITRLMMADSGLFSGCIYGRLMGFQYHLMSGLRCSEGKARLNNLYTWHAAGGARARRCAAGCVCCSWILLMWRFRLASWTSLAPQVSCPPPPPYTHAHAHTPTSAPGVFNVSLDTLLTLCPEMRRWRVCCCCPKLACTPPQMCLCCG